MNGSGINSDWGEWDDEDEFYNYEGTGDLGKWESDNWKYCADYNINKYEDSCEDDYSDDELNNDNLVYCFAAKMRDGDLQQIVDPVIGWSNAWDNTCRILDTIEEAAEIFERKYKVDTKKAIEKINMYIFEVVLFHNSDKEEWHLVDKIPLYFAEDFFRIKTINLDRGY